MKLWFNADDFGLAQGINRGVIRTAEHGVLNSASLMVDAPATADAVDWIRRNPATLTRVGLHLNWVGNQGCNRPSYRYLTDPSGRYPARWLDLSRRLVRFGRRLTDEIEREGQRQIETALGLGLRLTHLDSHDHVHAFPAIRHVVVRLAKKFEIGYVRCPLERAGFTEPRRFFASRRLLSYPLARSMHGLLTRAGIETSDHFYGLVDSGRLDRENLLKILNQVSDGVVEIACHPGYPDDQVRSIFPVELGWDREVEALTDPAVIAKTREMLS